MVVIAIDMLSNYHCIGPALKTSLLVFVIANALFNTNSVLDRIVIIGIHFNAVFQFFSYLLVVVHCFFENYTFDKKFC